MLPRLFAASALVLLFTGVTPPNYSDKGLCDLWAGARCYATQCLPDGKQRCTADSAQCRGRGDHTVSQERADRVAACAKALLQGRCGDPLPPECSGVDAP